MRLLEQQRCDKLIIIVSANFSQDDLTLFITRYAQALQIRKIFSNSSVGFLEIIPIFLDDNKKIIPCTRDNCGIVYNLKGYSVLSLSREGKLFNFWERLKSTLEDGRVSEKRFKPEIPPLVSFDIKKDENSDKGIKMKAQNIYSNVKRKMKKVLVKEQ